jgi:hypothetical protein
MSAHAPLRRPSANLELIARGGGRAQRLLARLPTYFADLRENPSWLPMFILARTMPARRLHWLFARNDKREAAVSPVFGGVDRADVVAKQPRASRRRRRSKHWTRRPLWRARGRMATKPTGAC